MTIMALFVSITRSTFFAKEGPTFALGLGADVDEERFGMFGAS